MRYFANEIAKADPSWQPILIAGLEAMDKASPGYLEELSQSYFLPSDGKIFAAFSQPIGNVKYVLVGEGPYPRVESANGYCFMDAAVDLLWSNESAGGLSKKVNRATSLRNFMKMLMVAESHIDAQQLEASTIAMLAARARQPNSGFITSMGDLQTNFLESGFLLLNASLVFRKEVAPALDAKAWFSFMRCVVEALVSRTTKRSNSIEPCFILWGKIADKFLVMPELSDGQQVRVVTAEHPYNLSFISNADMHKLFGPLRLLMRAA